MKKNSTTPVRGEHKFYKLIEKFCNEEVLIICQF